MELTGLYADAVYVFVILFGMYAHWQKKSIKSETASLLFEYVKDNFWKTTFPAIAAGVVAYFATVQLSPESFYPVGKFGILTIFLLGYTSDSLLNGEIQNKPKA